MWEVATVSAGFAKALASFAASKGVEQARLLACVGLRPEDFSNADARLPFAKYVALMRAAKTLCENPALALEFGASGDYRRISIVGLIAYASSTMAEALSQLNRYGRLVVDVAGLTEGPRYEIVLEKGERWMIDRRIDPNAFPELTETSWSRFICTTRRDFPEATYALAAEVTHAAPPYRDVYEALWQVPVKFEASRNAIQTTTHWGELKVQPDNRYVFGVFTERGDALLRELQQNTSLRGRVEALLLPLLHTGDVGVNTIAAKLETSRQTLHRNLKTEGVTFEQVLDELRHTMALDYLNARKVSVNETAYLVGFSDPTAFSRAFKRWTGTSPRGARPKG